MSDKVTKFLESLDKKLREKLKQKLLLLKNDPFAMKGVKKMEGFGENTYRLRVGKIRIIYRIHKSGVEVIDIDFRGNIY